MSRPRTFRLGCRLRFSVLAAATAARGTALIIGNSNYSNFRACRMRADATMLAETLVGNGYDVSLLTNAGAQDMHLALARALAGAAGTRACGCSCRHVR